jgi:hypothetical protein
MKKQNIIKFMLVFLLLSVSCVSAVTFTTENWVKMITEYHFSLGNFTGNGTNPNGEEDDIAWINFLVSRDSENQKLKLTFIPNCFSPSLNASENMYLNFYCVDGTYEVLDLKPACAGSDYEYRWVQIGNITGQTFINNIPFYTFWCAFQRNTTNVERIPTELKVRVDSMGLSTPSEDTNTIEQRSAITDVASGIGSIVNINVQVWKIIFNVFEIGILLIAFIGIPILLIMLIRWAINKVKGM